MTICPSQAGSGRYLGSTINCDFLPASQTSRWQTNSLTVNSLTRQLADNQLADKPSRWQLIFRSFYWIVHYIAVLTLFARNEVWWVRIATPSANLIAGTLPPWCQKCWLCSVDWRCAARTYRPTNDIKLLLMFRIFIIARPIITCVYPVIFETETHVWNICYIN